MPAWTWQKALTVERFDGLRQGCLPTWRFRSRLRSSLGYLTPAEFEAQWEEEHILALDYELGPA
jgi:hypothetical protein